MKFGSKTDAKLQPFGVADLSALPKLQSRYLCNSCGGSGSCQGWGGVHLSSPSGVDCPSEPDVCPSGTGGVLWRKASSDGRDWTTKPKHCPCGCEAS